MRVQAFMRFILTALMTLLLMPAATWARPIRDGTSGVSCPDPTVVDAHVGHYRYYVACTSDFDPDSFPIRGSNDLVHWRQLGYISGRTAAVVGSAFASRPLSGHRLFMNPGPLGVVTSLRRPTPRP